MYAALLALLACAPTSPPDAPIDADRDGVVAGLDCDDGDPEVNPGAPERCNGIDDDCDGLIDDEDAHLDPAEQVLAYRDADGDGFGDPAVRQRFCTVPTGWAEQERDCDDTRSDVHPDGLEICDADDTDEDCDDLVDDEDPSVDRATGIDAWPDRDGDGFGDATAQPLRVCDAGQDLADNALDCDDTRIWRYPGALEVCDGLPDDCDTLATWEPEHEAGLATWNGTTGVQDLTTFFATGTAEQPLAASTWDTGELWLCPGTWYWHLQVDHPLGIIGIGPGVVLAGDGTPVLSAHEPLEVEALEIQAGHATAGAAIACDATEVTLQQVTLTGGSADLGGAIHATGCTLTAQDSHLTGNNAEVGAALYASDSDITLVRTQVTDHLATDAAITLLDSTLDLDQVSFQGNTPEDVLTPAGTYSWLSAVSGQCGNSGCVTGN